MKSIKSNSTLSKKSTCSSKEASKVCKVHSFSPCEIKTLRQKLLSWYVKNKRDLPWRTLATQETDRNLRGYGVWVSEVMLQQTQVATVVEYYNKWIKRWPGLQDLAKASLEEVNEMWAGLGYYSRARRLHEGCQMVVNEMNGEMPSDAASLMKSLPGVGKYTAAAIASIAFNEPVGLVDGNVVRVLSRLRVIGADSSNTAAVEMFWNLVENVIPTDQPGDFNQAMMELGATVCTPKSPQCNSCPVREVCLAQKQLTSFSSSQSKGEIKSYFTSEKQKANSSSELLQKDIEELIANDCQLCLPSDLTWDQELGVCNYPRKAKRKEARRERVAVCVLEYHTKDDVLLFLAKRPSSGLLASLWEFPNVTVESDSSDEALLTEVKKFLKEEFMIMLSEKQIPSDLGQVVHQFSHIHHTYVVLKTVLTSEPVSTDSASGRATKWVLQSDFLEMAVSTAMKKVYNFYKGNGKLKKAGVKRKREQKDSNKGQKVLDSFFTVKGY